VLLGLVGATEARGQSGVPDDDVLASCLRTLQRFADAGW